MKHRSTSGQQQDHRSQIHKFHYPKSPIPTIGINLALYEKRAKNKPSSRGTILACPYFHVRIRGNKTADENSFFLNPTEHG